MWILQLLPCLLVLLQVVIGAVWIHRPQNTSVAVGGNVTLKCQFSDDPGIVTWNKNGATLAVGTSIWLNSDRFSIPESSKYNLVITNVKKEDDDDYTCNAQNVDGDKAVTAHLSVFLPPGQPTISTNDSRDEKVEKDVVVLTCSSTGGNPSPTFRWTKNGNVLNSNIVESKIQKGLSSSHLTVHLDYTDHLALYSCSVYNSVNQNSPLFVSTQLKVLYHPVISFSPYRDLSVLLGEPGSLLCNVSANPSVTSVSWTKGGQNLPTTNPRIDFTTASRTDSGTYSCSASNIVNGQQKTSIDTATVTVIYAPIISIPSIYEVDESSTLDLTCNVDANPPSFYTKWQKIDNSIQSNNQQLIIDNIKRSHKGNYSCVSRNEIHPSGKDKTTETRTKYTYLYVRYAPGNSYISPVAPVFVGDALTLACTVSDPGYPNPTYEWRRTETNQILPTTSATLAINGVTLQDNGNYSCTPRNTIGSGGTSNVQVIVNERPSFVGVHKDKDTINNNRTDYWLQCKVRGRPEPVIQWYKNGQPLDTSGKFYQLQTNVVIVNSLSYLVTSQVYLQGTDRIGTTNPQISDIANYTCKETTTNLEHTMELYIYFPPKLSSNAKVAAISGGSAKLTCISEGYPVPVFTWKRNNAEITSGGRLTIYEPKFISVTRSESIIQIDKIVGPDFGDYTCEMANQFGKVSKTITLTVKNQSSTPDLTEEQVVIIGCVCAAILIALLTVLVCIICRRRKLAKQLPPQTPSNLAANGHTSPPQKPPRGFENADSDIIRNGYPPFPRQNGNVPLDTSYDPEFENEMNRRNANKSNGGFYNEKQGDISFTDAPRSPTKDRQFIDLPAEDRKGEFNNGPESGYNTPDNPKPKKVIYEVVV